MPSPQQREAATSISATSEAIAEDQARVAVAETTQELIAAMRAPLRRCTRAAVCIAAPTTGWSVIGNYMDIARDLGNLYKDGAGCPGGQTKLRAIMLVGHRFDVITKIQEKGEDAWPTCAPS